MSSESLNASKIEINNQIGAAPRPTGENVPVNYVGAGMATVPFSNSGRMDITGRAEGCHCRLRRLVHERADPRAMS